MVTKKALALLRRMEIAVNADCEPVARALEKSLHAELRLSTKLKTPPVDSRIA